MPNTKYLEILIAGQKVDVSSLQDVPVSISYTLENVDDFQKKRSSEAFDITIPATLANDKIANTFHNPNVVDLTEGQVFRGNQPAKIIAGGIELLVGKAFLKQGAHDSKPLSYVYNFYGNNSDWAIDLKEATLYDFLKQISFEFTKANIIASWGYDGTDQDLPYVFGPVRYGQLMESAEVGGIVKDDYNMRPDYMKPALSKYWIIFWALKSVGYKVVSEFFDTEYFRRQCMPWTWGSFLDSDGTRMDVLKFLAKSSQEVSVIDTDYEGLFDVMASNDTTNGAYDNNNAYQYLSGNAMTWVYPTDAALNFGTLDATFYINLFVNATAITGSYITLEVQWYKNGVQVGPSTLLLDLDATGGVLRRRDSVGPLEEYHTLQVAPGDTIAAKIWLHVHSSSVGRASIKFSVDEFTIAYFRIPMGGTINFENFLGLKKYKFLDFLRGVVDEFNLSFNTDTINKVVVFEPTHPHSLTNNLAETSGGYFNGDFIDWSQKQDLKKISIPINFTDSERELIFKYKDDTNDGQLKKIQDRESNKLGLAKYVFPDRFKAGKKEIENRFFSPTMHYDVVQWATETTEAPQMVIMSPENVSNVSRGEAQNTFLPKSVYYKGTTTDYKWVFDNETTHPWPQMFAVNYKPGGENDPILSYADEAIGNEDAPVIGKGLLRRFYLQRLAIMRNGQYYKTYFRLNNNDISNFLHREHIVCRGQKWELVEIKNYQPLKDESTECFLRKWSPITNA